MTEAQKEWAQRLLLLALVWFAAWLISDLVGEALGLVLLWLAQVSADLHGPPAAAALLFGLGTYLVVATDFFALGFGCCLLLETDWRKAGLLAWLIFGVAIPAATDLRFGFRLHLRPGDLAALAFGAAASLWGARTARRYRYNQYVAAFHDLVLRTVVLD